MPSSTCSDTALAFRGPIRSPIEALVMSPDCDMCRALARGWGGRDKHGKMVFISARRLTFSCKILHSGRGDV